MSEVQEGYKMTELGEIPIEWEVDELQDLVEILDGLRKPIKKNDRQSGLIPYYGATGIIDWVNDYIFNEPLILVGEDGENLISRVLPMAFKIEGKAWVNNHAHVLKNKEEVDIDFLTYQLEATDYKDYITGSAQPKLNQAQLKKIRLVIPSFKEQQKIADILATVDKQIKHTKQMIEQAKELKHGLMQQLLTKGIGHSEFKESELGEIPIDWKIQELGDLFSLKSGENLPAKNIIEGNIPVYGGNGITGYHNQFLFEDTKLIIGRVGALCGNVSLTSEKVWITDNALYIKTQLQDFDYQFMYYLLTFINLNEFANKNAQPVISGKIIYEMRVALPFLSEQQKIAEILSSVDDQIDIYEKEKEKYEELKKSLMQQLLTGKIRVKVDE